MAARPVNKWNLYLSAEHDCHYLPDRKARIAVLDDEAPIGTQSFTRFTENGFRRSGRYLYRPACAGCKACQSLRIPVAEFRPNRSQRRTIRRNADISLQQLAPRFNEQHYALFKRYIEARHHDGVMMDTSRDTYISFLDAAWTNTQFYEFRAGSRLLAVAVVDQLLDALSAVYTFFDPDEAARGPGNYAILSLIDSAHQAGLSWLYLGYWVAGSAKMAYKSRFRPHDVLTPHGWQRVD